MKRNVSDPLLWRGVVAALRAVRESPALLAAWRQLGHGSERTADWTLRYAADWAACVARAITRGSNV